MGVVHLREEHVRSHFGVVGLAAAYGVDGHHGNARALEKFRNPRVGGRHVGGEAVALVEPIGLAELADDIAVFGEGF